MKISKKKLGDICAEVSAQSIVDAMKMAEQKGNENAGQLGYGKLLMDVLVGNYLIKALGLEDDTTEIEITNDDFTDATQKVMSRSFDGFDGEAGILMMLESAVFTSKVEERLFGKEKKDEA